MKEINVCVIGSGSTYCPELVDGFLQARDSLKLKKISFMDIDDRKRNIVGNLCIRMLKAAGIDTGAYPSARTYMVGVQIKL